MLINVGHCDPERGFVDIWVTWARSPVAVWDGPDDDEHYRVTYVSIGESSSQGTTDTRAVSTPVGWPRTMVADQGRRFIVPWEYSFEWSDTDPPRVLPEQELIVLPGADRLSHLIWIRDE